MDDRPASEDYSWPLDAPCDHDWLEYGTLSGETAGRLCKRCGSVHAGAPLDYAFTGTITDPPAGIFQRLGRRIDRLFASMGDARTDPADWPDNNPDLENRLYDRPRTKKSAPCE